MIRGIKKSWIEEGRLKPELFRKVGNALIKLSRFLKFSSLQLDMSDSNDLILLVDDILQVKLGDTENLAKKVEALEAIIGDIGEKLGEVEYIDVRYKGVPAVKFRK